MRKTEELRHDQIELGRLQERLKSCQHELAAVTASNKKAINALESALAGVWDGHYGKGVSIEYANALDAEVKNAIEALKGKGP